MRKSRIKALILATLICVVIAGTASAHFIGGKFPHTPGTLLLLGYTYSGPWQALVVGAVNSWNDTPNKVHFYRTDISTSKVDYYVQDIPASFWGTTVHYPCTNDGNCTYSSVNIFINTRTLTGESNYTIQKVMAHEAGHALGLADVDFITGASIMRQGYVPYYTPQQHDINDVAQLYP